MFRSTLLALLLPFTVAVQAKPTVLTPRLHHLRIAGPREWSDFPEKPEAPSLVLRFAGQRNPPWDRHLDGPPFEPLQYERLTESIVVEPHELLEMYSTTSSLAAISREERETLFEAVRPLLAGPYRLPLKHELTWTRLA